MVDHEVPPTLRYPDADVPAGLTELTVRRKSADRLCVWVPPARWWPLVRSKFKFSAAMTIAPLLMAVTGMMHVSTTGRSLLWWLSWLIPSEIAVVFGLAVLIGALPQFGRRIGFELDPYELGMTTAGPLGVRRRRWPRSEFDGIVVASPGTALRLRVKSGVTIVLVEVAELATARAVAGALMTGLLDIPAE